MLLFVVGAVFGEGQVLLCVAGAVFGEGQVLLFVAGAALGECLNVRLASKRCILLHSHLRGGLRFAFSCSDHARIILGSCSDRPRMGNDVSPVFRTFLPHVKWSFCVAGAVFGEVGS